MALIHLSLRSKMSPHASAPTTSQILSLITSNPNLQDITLWFPTSDDDLGSRHGSRLPLRRLKQLSLVTNFSCALTILQQLEFPDRAQRVDLGLVGCTVGEIRRLIGPYIRDCLQGYGGPEASLLVSAYATVHYASLRVSVVSVGGRVQDERPPCAQFTVTLPHETSGGERDEVCSGLLSLPPKERVAHLVANLPGGVMKELLVTMPNVEVLHLRNTTISDSFLLPDQDGPNAHKKLLPSLQTLRLDSGTPADDDWNPLIRYLVHQTNGTHSFSKLRIEGRGVHVCVEVQEQIKNLVKRFDYCPDPNKKCPFNRCSD